MSLVKKLKSWSLDAVATLAVRSFDGLQKVVSLIMRPGSQTR